MAKLVFGTIKNHLIFQDTAALLINILTKMTGISLFPNKIFIFKHALMFLENIFDTKYLKMYIIVIIVIIIIIKSCNTFLKVFDEL